MDNREEKRLKRIETKLTHLMEVLGINTEYNPQDPDRELNPDTIHDVISLKTYDDLTVVSLLHEDVSIKLLKDYLKNHIGTIIIMCGDEFICKWQR